MPRCRAQKPRSAGRGSNIGLTNKGVSEGRLWPSSAVRRCRTSRSRRAWVGGGRDHAWESRRRERRLAQQLSIKGRCQVDKNKPWLSHRSRSSCSRVSMLGERLVILRTTCMVTSESVLSCTCSRRANLTKYHVYLFTQYFGSLSAGSGEIVRCRGTFKS